MTVTLIAHDGWTQATNPSGALNTTGATLLVMGVSKFGSNPTPVDSYSNTWLELTEYTNALTSSIWYAANPTVGAGHTFNYGGSATTACVMAFSGIATTSPLDQQNGNASGGPATTQPGSITPSGSGYLIVTQISWNTFTGSASINDSFTITDQIGYTGSNFGAAAGYYVQPTAGAINPTWTLDSTAANVTTSIASFVATGGSGPVFVPCGRAWSQLQQMV